MENDLIICSDPKSSMSEAIRTLRTNLQFSAIDKKLRTILITSSVPSEGKSFVASNLAVAFAEAGSKVLLIDADMRRGRQHMIFKQKNQNGLSNLLIKDVDKEYKEYINKTNVKNLKILFKGITPPNPSELLNSERNKRLIEILKKDYDLIIFDGAPINGLPDSLVLSTLVDGIIMVTAAKETSIKLLENCKRNLDNVNANILGVVLNKAEGKKSKYYGSYYG